MPGKQYVIGVDPAGGGTEGDYSCAQVIERETGMQCGELHAASASAGVGEEGDGTGPEV